jgi:SPP1 gp7 family putative phage head morphogenesis protein
VNEAQSLRTVRNVLRLENLSADIAAPVQRELTRILQEVAAMVEAMDDDMEALLRRDALPSGRTKPPTLFQETRWRFYQAQLRAMLEPVSDGFRDLLIEGLANEIPRQVQEAERILLDAGVTPYQTAAEVLAPGVGTDGSVGVPQITRTQLHQIAQETKVLGKPLGQLFQSASARPPVETDPRQVARYSFSSDKSRGGVFIRSQINNIDKVVKQGFLLGETNSEIANNLKTVGVARSHREAAAIARTAVMQMSADAHQVFYDANSSVVAGYEFDALLDYRTCPRCSPWDGRTAIKRSDLPATPVHVNCRCSVIPLTETELERRKDRGPQRRTVIELVEVSDADMKALAAEKDPEKKRQLRDAMRKRVEANAKADGGADVTAARSYAQVYTDKETKKQYWRVAKDIKQKDHPLTHGEFLAQTSDVNMEKALLSKKRAERFKELLKTKGPDEALMDVTKQFYRPKQMPPSMKRQSQRLPPIGHSNAVTEAPAVRPIPRQRRPRPGVASAEARRLQNLLRRRGVR